jgi:two-component system, cell cycle response regulator DivK
VDGYEASRLAMIELLRDSGHSVAAADAGADGLRIAREQLPRMIIYSVSSSSRAELNPLEELRAEDGVAHIPVLLVSGAVSPEQWDRAESAGCAGYLDKPCSPERLLQEVRRILAEEDLP